MFALEHTVGYYSNRPKGVYVARPVTKRQGAFKFKPTDKPEQSCSPVTLVPLGATCTVPVVLHKMHLCPYDVIAQDTRQCQH